jgi:signal transduction histidine kinase
MKKKLKIVFALIILSLCGIIFFQIYWVVNAYRVNKEKFDTNIDLAMQRAIDDCKKDYLDSLRVLIAKRLSPPETKLKVDTETYRFDHSIKFIYIDSISNLFHAIADKRLIPFPEIDQYKKQIGHEANQREVLAQVAFNIPALMSNILRVFGEYDIATHGIIGSYTPGYSNEPYIPADRIMRFDKGLHNSIYELKSNYRQSDSLKIFRHLAAELEKLNIKAPFLLRISEQSMAPKRSNAHYSETREYSYKYHGFRLFLPIVGPELFVKAVIGNAQTAIIKKMVLTLLMSALLIVFTIFCFWYIFKTIMRQKKLAELKDDFINNMTHELKTPIATMTVAIEGLQKFNALNDPEKTQRYLQASRNELMRLNDIVSRVLNVAAFGDKEVKLVKERINIDDLVRDVMDTEQLKADKKVDITYENKSDLETIDADKLHFRNVLVNLVDNAIKYSNDPVLIKITCYKVGSNALFSVKDNGIGIPNSHINLVFTKFHRVPTGNVHNVKGTGLGLNYVKYAIEAHGGNVIAQSEVNAGSEFIISIPIING